MKKRIFYAVSLLLFMGIMSCQKIEIPEKFNAFYVASIDGNSYVDSTNYEIEKGDGENFEIKLIFSGGSGYQNIKIYNTGFDEFTNLMNNEITDKFSITQPEIGSKSGSISISGVLNHDEYLKGIVADIDKISFNFYIIDELGVTRIILLKFVKP